MFHSFQDFSIRTGNEAFFDNANDISNIFSRVTGGNVSDIDGAIRADGSANLFLINPAGIIFGENASLNIGGSFYGSSASSILFEDGEFSATTNIDNPLLTINAPIGLGIRDNPGEIVNRSVVENSEGEFIGLEVPSGNSLVFVGGNINFENGNITANEGNITLGGLSQAGTVDLNSDGSFTFRENITKADINFTGFANADVTGNGGSITLNAQNLNLEGTGFGNNVLTAGITSASNPIDAQAGDIVIDVVDNITLSNGRIINDISSGGIGNSGSIIISTSNLEIIDGGVVLSSTQGNGNAGNIDITARETIRVNGESEQGNISSIISQVNEEAEGNAGSIRITTGNLFFTDGGSIFANAEGMGNAGSVEIIARDTVSFDGESSGAIPTGIVNVVLNEAEGNSGDLTITTGNLSFTNGARIDSSTEGIGDAGDINISARERITFNGENSEGVVSSAFADVRNGAEGNAGNINITTTNLNFLNGGRLFARTSSQGDSGNVTITASDTITFDGASDPNVGGFSFPSGIINGVDEGAEGNGGDVNLTADNINFLNGATVTASAQGQGNAGNVEITANSLNLDGGEIIAETNFGEGGEITLSIEENIILRNNSRITAQAFEEADGGNIAIDTTFLIAFPDGNNDIIANAQQGAGGNIFIDAESLFGIQQRSLNNSTNDINASSEFSLDGNVTINTPDLNPLQGVTELPNNVVELEQTVAQVCQADRESIAQNTLTIEGRGGISTEPGLPLDSQIISIDGKTDDTSAIPEPIETSLGKIQPARGVKVTESGKVILTAYRTDNLGDRIPQGSTNCITSSD